MRTDGHVLRSQAGIGRIEDRLLVGTVEEDLRNF